MSFDPRVFARQIKSKKDQTPTSVSDGVPNVVLEKSSKTTSPNSIQVQILSQGRSVSVPHVEGQSLDVYLDNLGASFAAKHGRVFDLSNLAVGKLRHFKSYVPKPGAQIIVGTAGYSPVGHLQRTKR